MNNAEGYYDKHSVDYVEKWDLSDEGLKRPANYYRLQIINSMIEMAHLKAHDKVVEIGCGTGLVLRELLKITKPIYGTDISAEMLDRAKTSLLWDKKVSIVHDFAETPDDGEWDVFLMRNNLLELELPKYYFDKIISMEVLRYVDDVPRALQNVRKIMKEETVFVFTATNFFSFSLFPIKYYLRNIFNKINKKEELLQYFVTEGSLKHDIQRAGLKVVAFKKLNLLSFNPAVKGMVNNTAEAKKIVKFDLMLSKIPIINHLFDTLIFAVKLDI